MKITINMSKGAYDIAKRVYAGELTRKEGKCEINRITGMKALLRHLLQYF